jgi:hypothetical protein
MAHDLKVEQSIPSAVIGFEALRFQGPPPAERAGRCGSSPRGAEKTVALFGAGPIQVPAAGGRGRQRTLFLLDSDVAAAVPPQIGGQGAY